MYISQAPLRISIGGGGTDLPAYYERHGTTFSSLAINKYISVAVNKRFYKQYFIRYSENEEVDKIEEIKHDIVRTALLRRNYSQGGLEIGSFADVPGGTGLGSSGTFTVALVHALNKYFHVNADKFEVAREATDIELRDLGRPIGLQDQYIAAFGGLSEFEVSQLGQVKARTVQLDTKARSAIRNNLLLFYTGVKRNAALILNSERNRFSNNFTPEDQHVKSINLVDIGLKMTSAVSDGDMEYYGELLHEYWLYKRQKQSAFTHSIVDEIYSLGVENGALGGKLVGAGGSGFVLFATNDPKRLKAAMAENKIIELKFDISDFGVRTL